MVNVDIQIKLTTFDEQHSEQWRQIQKGCPVRSCHLIFVYSSIALGVWPHQLELFILPWLEFYFHVYFYLFIEPIQLEEHKFEYVTLE